MATTAATRAIIDSSSDPAPDPSPNPRTVPSRPPEAPVGRQGGAGGRQQVVGAGDEQRSRRRPAARRGPGAAPPRSRGSASRAGHVLAGAQLGGRVERAPGRPGDRAGGSSVQTTRSRAGASARDHRRRVLVLEDRQAGDDRAPRGELGQRLGERGGAVGVVGDVDEGSAASAIRSSRPGILRSAAPRPPARGRARQEGLGGGAGQGEVAALKAARGAQPDPRPGILGRPHERAPRSRGAPLGERRDLRADPAQDQGRVVAQHRELLGGDLRSVSPSHSVWSRPTEVSAVTREGIVLVASSRPPSPASITATSTRARPERRRRPPSPASNWVTASPSAQGPVDDRGRLGAALDRGGELGRGDLLAADQDSFGPTGGVRRDAGAAGDSVRLQQGGGHPGHRGLAVGADHMDRGEAMLRHAEHRGEPVHPLEAQPPADRLQRIEVGLRVYSASSSSSAR